MARLASLALMLALSLFLSAQDKKPAEKKEPPLIKYSIPLIAKVGEKQKLTLRGKKLDGVKEITVTGAEGAVLKVLSSKKIPNLNNSSVERLGDSEIDIELDLPKTAEVVKLIAGGTDGKSAEFGLTLTGKIARVAEREPNDGFDQAQAVPIPAAIDGVIKAERDVDVYKIDGKKDDVIRFTLEANRLGSPLDGILTIYDSKREVVRVGEIARDAFDPEFQMNLPADGVYYIVVMDAHDSGGTAYGYRLIIEKK